MNRGFSLFVIPLFHVVATGCSGSDDSPGVAVATANPDVPTGTSDASTAPVNSTGGSDAGTPIACSNGGCTALAIRNLCDSPRTTLIKDEFPADNAANAVIQQALLDNCVPAPAATTLEKGASGPIDPMTGRPLSGKDDLLTIAGGAYVQKTVQYLDLTGATPVYLSPQTSAWQYISRSPGAPILAEMPYASFGPTHDIFVIELVRDPLSGAPVLITFGQEPESTAAAAWYVAHQMLPNRSSFGKSWYVYEWTGADEAGHPPTYALKASGP